MASSGDVDSSITCLRFEDDDQFSVTSLEKIGQSMKY